DLLGDSGRHDAERARLYRQHHRLSAGPARGGGHGRPAAGRRPAVDLSAEPQAVRLNGLGQDATMDPSSGMFFGTGTTDVTSPTDATMQIPDTLVDSSDPNKYFTTAYYANQIAQFQQTLIQLDQTAQ